MDQSRACAEPGPAKRLHRNVKLFGLASLLSDIASETAVPLLPDSLLKVLGGSKSWLGVRKR